MKLSLFGEKFTAQAGITSLMNDLGNALASDTPMIMMGGGNPGHIPRIQDRFRQRLIEITESPSEFRKLIGIYDAPQGEKGFIEAVVQLLNRTYDWNLTAKNVAVTNGSQAAFFMLFNMLGGEYADGQRRHIQLPLTPEYIGYSDAGLSPGLFQSTRPCIEEIDAQTFKYHVDFERLSIGEHTGAICVSRPTNPTGNVLTDDEIRRLDVLARQHNVPLIIDGAYGTPFPNLIFSQATPIWNDNIILCLSLSKFGLPAARTGIVVANEELIEALSGVNAILNLATGSFGAMLATDMVASGEILTLSDEVVKPFYQYKSERALAQIKRDLQAYPARFHKAEGAMFLWLWCPDLPVSNQVLYERLKARGVLVVSGHYFFPGLEEDWQHKQECLRITYSQDDDLVSEGLAIIAEEVKRAYDEG